MPLARVQCEQCGYLTAESSQPCPRCGLSLEHARVVATSNVSGTVYSGPDVGSASFATSFQNTAPRPKRRIWPWICVILAVGFVSAAAYIVLNRRSVPSETEALHVRELARAVFRGQPDLVATMASTERGLDFFCTYSRFGDLRLFDFVMEVPDGMSADGNPPRRTVMLGPSPNATLFEHDRARYSYVARNSYIRRKEIHDSYALQSAAGQLSNPRSADLAAGKLDDPFLFVKSILDGPTATAATAGRSTVGEYETLVFEINDGMPDPIRVYYAPALGNAIVRLEIPAAPRFGIESEYELRDVDLKVDPKRFEIPKGYKVFPEPVVAAVPIPDFPLLPDPNSEESREALKKLAERYPRP